MHYFFYILLFLFMPLLKLQGLYNGNPSFPMMPEEGLFIGKEKWLGIKSGYECDFMYNRKIRLDHRLHGGRRTVRTAETFSNFGIFTLTFNERVELFSTLGTMDCKILQQPYSNRHVIYHTNTEFAWGVGGRAILAYWGELQLSANAAYVQSDLSLSSLRVNGHSYPKHKAEMDFTEWQIGIGTSYCFDWFIPYIGLDYSNFRSKIDHLNALAFLFPKKKVIFKEVYPIGLYFGMGLCPERAFNVNVEARLFNENAVSFSADIKF